ncbi:MAG: hypothetical protein WCA79_08640 [Anaerolineales bacterium]
MSDAKTFKCPSCGSALEPDGDEKEIKCAYCGNTVIVPEELRDQDEDEDDPTDEDVAEQDQMAVDSKEIITALEQITSFLFMLSTNMKQIVVDLRLRKTGVETRAKILAVEDLHKRFLMNSASRYCVTLGVTDAKTGQHFSS